MWWFMQPDKEKTSVVDLRGFAQPNDFGDEGGGERAFSSFYSTRTECCTTRSLHANLVLQPSTRPAPLRTHVHPRELQTSGVAIEHRTIPAPATPHKRPRSITQTIHGATPDCFHTQIRPQITRSCSRARPSTVHSRSAISSCGPAITCRTTF
jgi:hypothetical protein